MSVRNGFTIEIYGFMHRVRSFGTCRSGWNRTMALAWRSRLRARRIEDDARMSPDVWKTVNCSTWKALKCQTHGTAVHVIVLVCWLETEHCLVTLSCLPCAFCFVPAHAKFAHEFLTLFHRPCATYLQLCWRHTYWMAIYLAWFGLFWYWSSAFPVVHGSWVMASSYSHYSVDNVVR